MIDTRYTIYYFDYNQYRYMHTYMYTLQHTIGLYCLRIIIATYHREHERLTKRDSDHVTY